MRYCYIFDIDGTLANTQHRRHFVQRKPKKFKEFFAHMHKDIPNQPIVRLLKDLRHPRRDYDIIVCSGRPDDYRDVTETWLKQHGIEYEKLYMRKTGDFRADDIVKSELLDQILKDGYTVLAAFDDRQPVVDMWRRRGVTCCQVDVGDF